MISSKDGESAVKQEAGGMGPAAVDVAGGASIDKVRDILFGSHLREFERRFARLEERLVKETSDLKEDVKTRLEALETYAKKEVESLGDQIKAEHDDRIDSHGNVSRELKETARSLERRATSLDEQLS